MVDCAATGSWQSRAYVGGGLVPPPRSARFAAPGGGFRVRCGPRAAKAARPSASRPSRPSHRSSAWPASRSSGAAIAASSRGEAQQADTTPGEGDAGSRRSASARALQSSRWNTRPAKRSRSVDRDFRHRPGAGGGSARRVGLAEGAMVDPPTVGFRSTQPPRHVARRCGRRRDPARGAASVSQQPR